MEPQRIVTFDLDSTLCDTEHRFNLINREGDTDWLAYAMGCADDVVVEGVARLVETAKRAGYAVHYVTGRHEASRSRTVAWLRQFMCETVNVSTRLHMDDTASGNHVVEFGSHAAFKAHKILKLVEDLDTTIVFHVDDHPSVAVELADKGIPVVCVRPPYEVRAGALKKLSTTNESWW